MELFALPNTWAFDVANNEYSKFSVIRNSGSIFIVKLIIQMVVRVS